MYYLGLDLGQANDYTALSVLQEPVWCGEGHGWQTEATMTPALLADAQAGMERHWNATRPEVTQLWLQQLVRFPLRTPYPTIVAEVVKRLGGPDAVRDDCTLVIDGTGVGAPVVDMFQQYRVPCEVQAITITGGGQVNGGNVPKVDLIGALQRSLQTEQLIISKRTEASELLLNELKDYRLHFTPSANVTYDARSGKHDDLVLSVALPVWWYHYTHPWG